MVRGRVRRAWPFGEGGAAVESYRLVPDGGSRDAEWVLEWDDVTLTLRAPDGQPVFEGPTAAAHRVVELYELYAEGKVSLATPHGSLRFTKQPAALAAVRGLVEAGLAGDAAFCAELRRQSLRAIPRGLVMFAVGGGLFGLYCWYASWAPDPPPGHWMRWIGWLVHGVLLILMGVGLAGLLVAYFGVRQWLRVRRIERRAAETRRHAEPHAALDPARR
jgi:hypothetical protein